ncbi:hypothetical protein TRFO_22017 [Tritrichomonas foetus]|uniref:Uncharacterized protein n=1 Tax=Tritrichomonas foetus TaxID=1144522 RepID=A0A1J4KIP3_9EUKA|nr:hypothetical protein TRFO_22017 [Tritrichomonas foetus]|eukprot:OHT09189.1 hypothetical protein TRFO_22017 [Tritrichomonas foetus]
MFLFVLFASGVFSSRQIIQQNSPLLMVRSNEPEVRFYQFNITKKFSAVVFEGVKDSTIEFNTHKYKSTHHNIGFDLGEETGLLTIKLGKFNYPFVAYIHSFSEDCDIRFTTNSPFLTLNHSASIPVHTNFHKDLNSQLDFSKSYRKLAQNKENPKICIFLALSNDGYTTIAYNNDVKYITLSQSSKLPRKQNPKETFYSKDFPIVYETKNDLLISTEAHPHRIVTILEGHRKKDDRNVYELNKCQNDEIYDVFSNDEDDQKTLKFSVIAISFLEIALVYLLLYFGDKTLLRANENDEMPNFDEASESMV